MLHHIHWILIQEYKLTMSAVRGQNKDCGTVHIFHIAMETVLTVMMLESAVNQVIDYALTLLAYNLQ